MGSKRRLGAFVLVLLRCVGIRNFYRQFRMNYPVVMGNAKIGVLYGGVLGLPIAFVIGRDDRIYSKHVAATDVSLLDREIQAQLQPQRPSPTN